MSYTTRTTCRVCGGSNLAPLFSLGEQYISNFVDKDNITTGEKCPIEIDLCMTCSLVQNRHTAPQELLYSGHYWYRSGVTATMRHALACIASAALQQVGKIEPTDIILDIGSNDGTLLRCYPDGIKVGVEPAKNLVEEGRRGIDIFINDFWNPAKFTRDYRKAKIITAIGMFYDLEDPNEFIKGVADVLHPDGVFIAQLMCLKNMLAIGDIGNFAHEHLEFYSLKSLRYLFGRHGLQIYNIETNGVNGESYRIYAKKGRYGVNKAAGSVATTLKNEEKLGIGSHSLDAYKKFYMKANNNRKHCVDFIQGAVGASKKVWVYGASTKGNTILQWYGLGHNIITAAADRSPEKWGKFTIGSGIPIVSEQDMRDAAPDYLLALPYAFMKEFQVREKEWRAKPGRKWLVPLPNFEIV